MCKKLIEDMRRLEIDHVPDGWPAIQMKDITRLCNAVDALNARQRVMWNLLHESMGIMNVMVKHDKNIVPVFDDLPSRIADTLAVAQIESNNVGYPHLKVQAA